VTDRNSSAGREPLFREDLNLEAEEVIVRSHYQETAGEDTAG
jgi:hypothetical protein